MALTILIVLVGIIGALYAVLGGMRAVAVSDTINGILLVLGSVLVVVFGFIAVGKLSGGGFIVGVKDVITSEPAKLNAIGGKMILYHLHVFYRYAACKSVLLGY